MTKLAYQNELLFLILYSLTLIGLRFYIDPDAIGYFYIAEQLNQGAFHESINPIWSPLGSWLLLPFLKLGISTLWAAKIANAFYSIVGLIIFRKLLTALSIKDKTISFFHFLAIFLFLEFSVTRLFADLPALVCFLAFSYIILQKEESELKYFKLGLITAIGFYAKSYFLYFGMVASLANWCYWFLIPARSKEANTGSIKSVKFSSYIIQPIITSLLIFPWILMVRLKFKNYLPGYLNLIGNLSADTDKIGMVAKLPTNTNAPSFFVDTSSLYSINNSFFHTNLLLTLLKKTVHNFVALMNTLFEHCVLVFITLIIIYIVHKRLPRNNHKIGLLACLCFFWMVGLLLFHVESRFIWSIIVSILACAAFIYNSLFIESGKFVSSYKKSLLTLFALGFLFHPFATISKAWMAGREEHLIAQQLTQNDIHGKLLFSNNNSTDFKKGLIISYLSKNRHTGSYTHLYSNSILLKTIRQFKIDYYIQFYETSEEKETILNSELSKNAIAVLPTISNGIVVMKFQ